MTALRVRVRGVVQGVGFRPFVYRIARQRGLGGWVLNGDEGVEIHVEGPAEAVAAFLDELERRPPGAAAVASVEVAPAAPEGPVGFEIRPSRRGAPPTARVSPDLALCRACRAELLDPADRRHGYPYVNCTGCGPRYSIVLDLPYDRASTTMRAWPMCPDCAREYGDPADRRFHAQPLACPACGPGYRFEAPGAGALDGPGAVATAAAWLRGGRILAVKGVGGYHLACDAADPAAVGRLRERKRRDEKPFALMARDLSAARALVRLSPEAEALLLSPARPIVLAPARVELAGVAPGNRDLGVMLPYAPLHELLFGAGAPTALVMTSANRSDEPIAYEDADAAARLTGLADGSLVGARPIARRVDDSVARVGPFGAVLLRRSRGYAPGAVAALPSVGPILALGADLKNAVTLVVAGQAFVGQHVGDLEHPAARRAFRETVDDLTRMYRVPRGELLVAHDLHPGYASTRLAEELAPRTVAVQHHRAHVASVLAERAAWETPVVGFAFDGAGHGDDGAVWGGEVFAGSLAAGLARVAHLRSAVLPGGDAAARFPPQAAAGFLAQVDGVPDMTVPPFGFPERYRQAAELVAKGVRLFPTTSVGRLFDAVAALVGFARPVGFEGQAAVWLEHLAARSGPVPAYPFPAAGGELDFRPLLAAVLADRRRGRDPAEIARAFHEALAAAVVALARRLGEAHGTRRVVLSGGVFQNVLLLELLRAGFAALPGWEVWVNRAVPPGDGGISLGQAALAALGQAARPASDRATLGS